jgi:hypothetical protein
VHLFIAPAFWGFSSTGWPMLAVASAGPAASHRPVPGGRRSPGPPPGAVGPRVPRRPSGEHQPKCAVKAPPAELARSRQRGACSTQYAADAGNVQWAAAGGMQRAEGSVHQTASSRDCQTRQSPIPDLAGKRGGISQSCRKTRSPVSDCCLQQG